MNTEPGGTEVGIASDGSADGVEEAVEEDDDDDEEDDDDIPDPDQYSFMFHVSVGEDVIYIEDLGEANTSGWLPIHACCMSHVTVDAGLRIIDQMLSECPENLTLLNTKTLSGPGAFNSAWTPLHM